jgi:hypothetical protein
MDLKLHVTLCIRFNWFWMDSLEGYCEHSTEPSGSVNCVFFCNMSVVTYLNVLYLLCTGQSERNEEGP